MPPLRPAFAALLAAGLFALVSTSPAADPPADAKVPTVIDAAGKEVPLGKWRFVQGTRRLAWLADEAMPKGPEAFVLREVPSTTYQEGVLTLIPVERIRAIRYDYDKETATVHVAGREAPVTGSLRYRGINTFQIEAEGEPKGKKRTLFSGGVPKGGARALELPGAKAPAKPPKPGEPFAVTILDPKAKNPTLPAGNLRALYAFESGAQRLQPALTIRKGPPIDLAKVEKLEMVAFNPITRTAACVVTLKDGSEQTVIVPPTASFDGKTGTLVGLLGDVPAGYKLFPLHAVVELRAGEPKKEAEKE